MNSTSNRHFCNETDTKDRLVRAAIALWERAPVDAFSIRSLAREAGTAASAIDYHFTSLDQLYGAAQNRARSLAIEWTKRQIEDLQPLADADLALPARAEIIGGLIDDWSENQRGLAIAASEARRVARRGGDPELHAQWMQIWPAFWHQVADVLGMADLADVLAAFHAGEGTQHLLRSCRSLDRALLHENVMALLHFAERDDIVPAPVRLAYREAAGAGALSLALASEPPTALDQAAAAVLKESGIDALTFRSVAARANETLGRTTWHFGSKSVLLERAFAGLYHNAVGQPPMAGAVTRNEMLDQVVHAVVDHSQPVLRALDEVILHIARSADHAALRAPIRLNRDPAAAWTLQSLLPDRGDLSPSLVAVFSSLCRGLNHLTVTNPDQSMRESLPRSVLQRFLRVPTKGDGV